MSTKGSRTELLRESFNGKLDVSPSANRQRIRLPPIYHYRGVKTEPSQSIAVVRHCKTESIGEEKEDTTSYRQLSRFIHSHLQKKIEHQEELHQRLSTQKSNEELSTGRSKPLANLRGMSNRQKKRNNVEQMRTEEANLNRPARRLKYMLRNQVQRMNGDHMKGKYKPGIDSYFDLSCLSNVKLGERFD